MESETFSEVLSRQNLPPRPEVGPGGWSAIPQDVAAHCMKTNVVADQLHRPVSLLRTAAGKSQLSTALPFGASQFITLCLINDHLTTSYVISRAYSL